MEVFFVEDALFVSLIRANEEQHIPDASKKVHALQRRSSLSRYLKRTRLFLLFPNQVKPTQIAAGVRRLESCSE